MKIFLFLLVVTSLIHSAYPKPISPSNVVIAINCGSENSYSNKLKIVYGADQYYTGGTPSDFGAQLNWPSSDNGVHWTERYGSGDFKYKIPLQNDGKYVLILSFSEVYFTRPGQKVFDVELGNVKIITDLDIYDKVGLLQPYEEFIEFELKNNNVYINDEIAHNAYNSVKKELNINFKKGKADNPKVNGIMIVKGTNKDTHQEEFEEFIRVLRRTNEENESRKRAFEERERRITEDDTYEDEEEDRAYVDSTKNRQNKETHHRQAQKSFIKQILNIPALIEISAVALLLVAIVVLRKVHKYS